MGGLKIYLKGEISNLRAVRKSCVSKINIEKGQKILEKHIAFKRPGYGLSPFKVSMLLNKTKKFIEKKNRVLKLEDFKQ